MTNNKDLLDLASDLSAAEISLQFAKRYLTAAYEGDRDELRARADALEMLREARRTIDTVTAEVETGMMTAAPVYPKPLSSHGPARGLDDYLAELADRYERLSAALRSGSRVGNAVTMSELRDLHSRIRAVQDEIDARGKPAPVGFV